MDIILPEPLLIHANIANTVMVLSTQYTLNTLACQNTTYSQYFFSQHNAPLSIVYSQHIVICQYNTNQHTTPVLSHRNTVNTLKQYTQDTSVKSTTPIYKLSIHYNYKLPKLSNPHKNSTYYTNVNTLHSCEDTTSFNTINHYHHTHHTRRTNLLQYSRHFTL